MNKKWFIGGLVLSIVLLSGWVSFVLLSRLLSVRGFSAVVRSVPGLDNAPATTKHVFPEVEISGEYTLYEGSPAEEFEGFWPRFRGPAIDNIYNKATLAESWPEEGPKQVWSVKLGEGHAAPAVWKGRVYLLDYNEIARADALRCFSLADGEEIWRRSYELPAKRNHGLSRTIPAICEAGLVTMGPRCHVMCVEPKTGDFKWGIDLQKEYGTEEPLWFTGQCPLIDENVAILAPAGTNVLLMGVDISSGDVVWKTPNPDGWKMSHSSIMPLTLHGEKMYVYAAIGGVVGVSTSGKILWSVPWQATVIAPSPLAVSDDRLFITAGYGAGSLLIQVDKIADGYSAHKVSEHGPKDWLACEQQTPILSDNLLFGIMPKDAGALKQQFVCYDPDGDLVWSSGKTARFGLGPFILADNKFYLLDDDGTLTMLRYSLNGYEQLAQHKVLDGHDAWGPMAFAGTRLLLRDSTHMICLEMGEVNE